jgi:type II secretory pathway component PulF
MAEILPHLAEIARRRAARRLEGALLTLYPAFLLLAVGAAATVLRTMAQKLLPEIPLQQQPQFPDAFGMLSTAAFLIGLVLLISFAGRLLWDLCAPVGRLLAPISARDDALEVFCRACGVFLRSGMPLPEALVRAAAATHSPAVQRQAGAVSRAVERGVPFGDALREAWRWPRGVLEIVRTGNAAGRPADAFDHAADFLRLRCEREAVRMRRRAAVLIVACGALVGATVYAVFSFITNTQNFVMGS